MSRYTKILNIILLAGSGLYPLVSYGVVQGKTVSNHKKNHASTKKHHTKHKVANATPKSYHVTVHHNHNNEPKTIVVYSTVPNKIKKATNLVSKNNTVSYQTVKPTNPQLFVMHSRFDNIGTNRYYVGVNGGGWLDMLTYPQFNLTDVNHPQLTIQNNGNLIGGLVGLYVGRNFNDYFGIEASYNYLISSTAKSTFYYTSTTDSGTTPNSVRTSINIIDLSGVAKLPISHKFNIFAKVGPSLIISNTTTSFDTTNLGADLIPGSYTRTYFDILVGLGASYDLSDKFILSTQYKNYGLFGVLPSYLSNSGVGGYPPFTETTLNTLTVGVAYKF